MKKKRKDFIPELTRREKEELRKYSGVFGKTINFSREERITQEYMEGQESFED
jgi:hypothetical protein